MTTQNQSFNSLLREFSDVTKENYNSFAYATGYYESLMTRMLECVPKKLQQSFVQELRYGLNKEIAKNISKKIA